MLRVTSKGGLIMLGVTSKGVVLIMLGVTSKGVVLIMLGGN